jgi:uncharacterized protein YprB with RNaseH-like and TPR domain
MKYFKTSDDDINTIISRTMGLPDSAAPPFTVTMYARAYNISVTTASKRINSNPDINEISKTRASELGFVPEARGNIEHYNVLGESLTLTQIQAKYSIPKTTLRKWKNNNIIEERIKMLSQKGYTNHLLSEGVLTSIWKYENGNLATVPMRDILYKIDDDDSSLRNNLVTAYNVTEVMNNYSHLRLFYSVITDIFKHQQTKFGSTLRGIKLQFIPNSLKALELGLNHNLKMTIPKQENVLKTPYQIEPDVVNTAFSITRHLNVLKVQGLLVELVDFDEFARRIASLTVGENYGSDSDNGDSILLGYRLVTSQFVATIEKTLLGRGVLRNLARNTHSRVYKHPYYELLDPDRPLGGNSCFFDAVKTWCKINKYKWPSNLKEVYDYNRKGVELDKVDKICLTLGIHLQVYGNPEGLKEVLIGEYGDRKSSDYEESIKLYFTLTPEPHFTCICGVKEKLHTCYVCNTYHQTQVKLYEHRKKFHSEEQNEKVDKAHKKKSSENKREVVLLYYDIETINNPETLDVEVYSVAWKWSMEHQVNCALESIHTKNPMDKFVEDIHQKCLNENIDVRMIAFNGSSFDLYPTLKKLGEYFNFKTCIYKASRFYSVQGSNKGNPKSSIKTWDPFLLFRGKLSSILTSFGIDSAKEDFDHVYIQHKYMTNGRNFDWIEDGLERKIISYNKQDVVVLEKLVEKILEVIPNALSYLTASSLSFAEFKKKCPYSKKLEKTLDEASYRFIRNAIIGGRVQTHHKYTTTCHSKNPLSMIDVVSLYPSQMVGNKYPIGNPIETRTEVRGKMGVYSCQINFQQMPVIVPRRRDNEPLDWTYCGSMSVTLSSVTIKQLRKHFGEDSVTVFGGYYWEKSVSDLFDGFVYHWIEVKKAEDRKKSKGKPFNKAMRETAKLILNSAFGKMIQKVIEDETNLIYNAYYLRMFKGKFDSGYDLFQVSSHIDLIKGKLKKIDYTSAKPQHIGLFILDYTKKKMYDEIFSQTKVYYSDTDSALIRKSELVRLQKEGILKIGSGLGEYDIEMDDIVTFHSIEPKSYALISASGNVKMRMKGVSLNSAWSDGETDENGEVHINPKICIKAYESIIKNRREIKFYTTCFSHKREGLKVYGEDRVLSFF